MAITGYTKSFFNKDIFQTLFVRPKEKATYDNATGRIQWHEMIDPQGGTIYRSTYTYTDNGDGTTTVEKTAYERL